MLSVWAGEVVYEQALRWQRLLASARADDAVDDVLLTLTHDRVYTAGRRADVAAHVRGTHGHIRVVRVDRGGDVTYHGPGQLVAYPIVALRSSKQVRPYVRALAEACVRTARSYGVNARADDKVVGVWVGDAKLAAIGVRIAGRVATHGLAFNVAPDLADFDGIVACGLADARVCSLASLGVDTTLEQVRRRLVAHLAVTLDRPVQPATPAAVGLSLAA